MEHAQINRIKLTVAYDGAAYAGWQAQKTGVGVQQKIEAALAHYFPGVGRIHSSSRTDTGVHALGMVAHVDLPAGSRRMSGSKLTLALNALLPADIRIVRAAPCGAEFHARFDASGKQYRYFVWNESWMNPLLRLHAWHVPQPLDVVPMRAAARAFLGRHDFRSFAANRNYRAEDTVRTLRRLDIRRSGPLWSFVIEADGFLYKMCRGLVGTLVLVGRGRLSPGAMERVLDARDRRVAGMTAPAQGLVLWKVFYRDGARPPESRSRVRASRVSQRSSAEEVE